MSALVTASQLALKEVCVMEVALVATGSVGLVISEITLDTPDLPEVFSAVTR